MQESKHTSGISLIILAVFMWCPLLAIHAEGPVSDEIAPSATPLEAHEDIRIGMSNALSGPASALGMYYKQGADTYFRKVNAGGGIHGRKIALISYDDGYEPLRTISNTRTLIEKDKAFLLFGYVGTPTSRVAMPIATHAGIPFVAPLTGARFLRHPVNPLVFNVRASYAEETENIVKYLVDKRHLKRIGIFIQNDGYGFSGREGVSAALGQRGLHITGVGKYERNTTDVASAVEALRKAKPDAVIMIGAYAPSAEFIKQSVTSGFNPIFINISFVGTKSLLQALGNHGEGTYISQVMPTPLDATSRLISSYMADSATFATDMDTSAYSALEGYVAARTLVTILEAAGPSLSRHAFVDAANRLGDFQIDDLQLHLDAGNHQALKKVYLSRIQGGRALPVEP